jgi:hypothetical protein
VALVWPYNNAQYCRLLRVIDAYFSRSAQERPGSGRTRHSLRIRCSRYCARCRGKPRVDKDSTPIRKARPLHLKTFKGGSYELW